MTGKEESFSTETNKAKKAKLSSDAEVFITSARLTRKQRKRKPKKMRSRQKICMNLSPNQKCRSKKFKKYTRNLHPSGEKHTTQPFQLPINQQLENQIPENQQNPLSSQTRFLMHSDAQLGLWRSPQSRCTKNNETTLTPSPPVLLTTKRRLWSCSSHNISSITRTLKCKIATYFSYSSATTRELSKSSWINLNLLKFQLPKSPRSTAPLTIQFFS